MARSKVGFIGRESEWKGGGQCATMRKGFGESLEKAERRGTSMAEVICINGHTNEVQGQATRFCRDCGGRLLDRCPNGHVLKPGAAFCATCGTAATRADDTTPVAAPPRADVAPTPATKAGEPETLRQPPSLSAASRPAGSPPTVATPESAPPPIGAPVPIQRKGRINPFVWVGIGLAVVLGGVAVAIALTSSKSPSASSPISHTQATTNRPSQSTQPSTTLTSPSTTQPLTQEHATELSGLLSQSANDRSAIVGAVADIANCGDFSTDETTLSDAYASRESLLSQLQSLDLAALPGGSQLNTYLTNAWQDSASSDQSYAKWASDLMTSGCTVNDDSDVNFQNAQVSDGQSTANKTSFAALWNPIASSYGLPTVTASSI
jgi:hypothetical protein